MDKINVSVIVLTYNTELRKIIDTLESILKQKKISFELIISDDGSENNHFDEIKEYLLSKNFDKFLLLEHTKNQGTVLNFLDGVRAAKGKYIKGLGAGDLLYDENVLFAWYSFMIEEDAFVSFCNARYFRKINIDHIDYIKVKDNPQRPGIYRLKKISKMKRNFLLYNDIILGAKFFVERELLIAYLDKIANVIKLAEDNIFRIMLCDNIPFYYFNKWAICYEYGTGVWSSKSGRYSQQLQEDWDNTNKILSSYCSNDLFGKRLKMSLDNYGSNRKIIYKIKKRLVLFDYYWFKLMIRIFPRYTN